MKKRMHVGLFMLLFYHDLRSHSTSDHRKS